MTQGGSSSSAGGTPGPASFSRDYFPKRGPKSNTQSLRILFPSFRKPLLTVPAYRFTTDSRHGPVDPLGSNQGHRAPPGPWTTEWLPAASVKEHGSARLQSGCSVPSLRFQVGTSCSQGKCWGKLSHLASFHTEDR